MTDNYIQWSKLLDFFHKYAHFEIEREIKCGCVNYLHLFVPTNNETEFSSTSKTRLLLLLKNNKT